MPAETWLLLLGMAHGLLHALDADHILAVSAVAVGDKRGKSTILRTAALWGLGHGGSLFFLTLVASGFGWAIPVSLSLSAEILVGVILITVGGALAWQLVRGHIRISRHSHDDLPAHTHIHRHNHSKKGDHRPVLVGVVHGVAGSAPILGVLPLLIKEQFLLAGVYIGLFSLCVALAMCVFGGLLGALVRFFDSRYRLFFAYFQALLATQAIAMGGYWIAQAV
jgi:hypothetical protein